jgi:hypothetical protein
VQAVAAACPPGPYRDRLPDAGVRVPLAFCSPTIGLVTRRCRPHAPLRSTRRGDTLRWQMRQPSLVRTKGVVVRHRAARAVLPDAQTLGSGACPAVSQLGNDEVGGVVSNGIRGAQRTCRIPDGRDSDKLTLPEVGQAVDASAVNTSQSVEAPIPRGDRAARSARRWPGDPQQSTSCQLLQTRLVSAFSHGRALLAGSVTAPGDPSRAGARRTGGTPTRRRP